MELDKQSKPASQAIKIVLALMIISAVSGGILATVFSITKEKIEYQEKQKIEKAILSILPQTKQVSETKIAAQILYECKNKNGEVAGLAFIAQGPGYQDLIKVLVVTNTDLSLIKGIEILESVETPGLGDKITKEEFKRQFENVPSALKLSKEASGKTDKETTIQAITGATISSQAVVDIINTKIEQLKNCLNEGK